MAWATLKYSPAKIDAAGELIARGPAATTTSDDVDEAIDIVSNWRSCHSFPLNTFQMTLRRKAGAIYEKALVAQRIKRLPAIQHKLERMQHLRLSELQDIAGCRCVLNSVAQVRSLHRSYMESDIRHRVVKTYDYIAAPKRTGYRSLHLVYEYRSDKSEEHNGRKIEMQLRTRLQHAWATTVETVGLFSSQKLKSNQGDKEWLRLFALMGSAVALREGEPIVPSTSQDQTKLVAELKALASKLDAKRKLEAYGHALKAVEPVGTKGSVFLLRLDASAGSLTVTEYTKRQLREANRHYMSLEKEAVGKPDVDVVLVSVDNLKLLRQAYPNYYLDTKVFVEALDAAMSAQFSAPRKT
jgi:hypothetical protein